jgi:hypothetical protein
MENFLLGFLLLNILLLNSGFGVPFGVPQLQALLEIRQPYGFGVVVVDSVVPGVIKFRT